MAAVAKRYYFDQRTRVQLAQEFGISRFKVTRLLEAALSSGIVRISIVPLSRPRTGVWLVGGRCAGAV